MHFSFGSDFVTFGVRIIPKQCSFSCKGDFCQCSGRIKKDLFDSVRLRTNLIARNKEVVNIIRGAK